MLVCIYLPLLVAFFLRCFLSFVFLFSRRSSFWSLAAARFASFAAARPLTSEGSGNRPWTPSSSSSSEAYVAADASSSEQTLAPSKSPTASSKPVSLSPEATARFHDVSAVAYGLAGGAIKASLKTSKVEAVKLMNQLGGFFRENYKEARRLAEEGL